MVRLDRRLRGCVGPRRGFQKLRCLYDGLTGLYTTLGRKPVDTTDDSALEHVCLSPTRALFVATAAMPCRVVPPKQTADPRFISTDAAVMMNGSANASFGREIRRLNRGIRTANDGGSVCSQEALSLHQTP